MPRWLNFIAVYLKCSSAISSLLVSACCILPKEEASLTCWSVPMKRQTFCLGSYLPQNAFCLILAVIASLMLCALLL